MHFSHAYACPVSSFPLPLPLLASRLGLRSISPPLHWHWPSLQTRLLFPTCLSPTPLRSLSDMDGAPAATSDGESHGQMVFEPILEEGVFRFDCSADARAEAYPSLSFVDQTARETPIKPVSFKVPQFIPQFVRAYGQQEVQIKLPAGTSFYGTGEASGPLERTGKRIFTWNTDAWGFGPGTTSLYQSHPWVLALLPDGKAFGVLADTTRRCEVDLREECNIVIRSVASYPVVTFGPFGSPNEVLMSLSHAIG